jgi:GR25 family glycosyltransferase involved in LPS biosynthesis
MSTNFPILLFAYNRPEHLQRTLESLFTNAEASESELHIFCDGPKPEAADDQIERIKQVASIATHEARAKEKYIHMSPINQGLSASIRLGVSQVLASNAAAIVLEDDLIFGRGFLGYMNAALKAYEKHEQVLQVSGFQFPFRVTPSAPFFMPITVTIGWGTWKRSWQSFDFSAPGYERLKKDAQLRRSFNLQGSYDYTSMLLRQVEAGRKDSWGVLFWWEVFRRNGYVLYPGYSLVQHNDTGNCGTHVSNYDHYDWPNWRDDFAIQTLPGLISSDSDAFNEVSNFIRRNRQHVVRRIYGKAAALIGARRAKPGN